MKPDPTQARQQRLRKARALSRVATGQVPVTQALKAPHKGLSRVFIYTLLTHAPAVGPARARQVLQAAVVWPLTCVGDLDDTQVDRIIENLPERLKEEA